MTSSSTFHVLGIEASCDDTAAAVLRFENDEAQILSSQVIGQSNLHKAYGGVVPEIAARAHAEKLDKAVQLAAPQWDEIDLIAVTTGPGLIGGLHAANAFSRAISRAKNIPLIGVNHLAGHALTPVLTHKIAPPYLMLLISGGHCLFLIVHDYENFERIGSTIDDSPGEAFDKIAKILNLGYPGGPEIEKEAQKGDPHKFALPRPLLDRAGFDFSFSGLKTATRRIRDEFVKNSGGMTHQERADLCAAFQWAVAEVIAKKSERAFEYFQSLYPQSPAIFTIAGGVAANQVIRENLQNRLRDCEVIAPPLSLCTDNAAMIAFAGERRFRRGGIVPEELTPRPRWPLDNKAEPIIGSGKKGAKA